MIKLPKLFRLVYEKGENILEKKRLAPLRIGLSLTLLFVFIIFCAEGKASEKKNESPKKVALLFLTYGDLNHSDFWKEYLLPHLDKFNIYVHPKKAIGDPFFAQFVIPTTYETTWQNTIIAQRGLLLEAFPNPENYKFLLVTNSCVPLVDAKTLYETLIKDDLSYFFWTSRGWWDPREPREVIELPSEHRTGNYQQFLLNRKHAKICVKDQFIINIVAKYPNDQESYPSCLFSVHGCLNEVVNFNYTYVDWNRRSPDNCHPYTFVNQNEYDFSILFNAKKSGHLLARKFSPEYPVEAIKKIIQK